MDVHPHTLLVQGLYASPVHVELRPDAGGVIVTWTFATDVLRAFPGRFPQVASLVRQFMEPRSILLAHDYWPTEFVASDPLVPDSPLSGWVDQDGAILVRRDADHFIAQYRVVSRSCVRALEQRFPRYPPAAEPVG